ncbi:hypothetical protein ACOSQ4_014962 [Xanthoceras sorbifolium]
MVQRFTRIRSRYCVLDLDLVQPGQQGACLDARLPKTSTRDRTDLDGTNLKDDWVLIFPCTRINIFFFLRKPPNCGTVVSVIDNWRSQKSTIMMKCFDLRG